MLRIHRLTPFLWSVFFLIFLMGLPDISQEYDIEFIIGLHLGTQPISMAPYGMTPAKLKVLKSQLQDCFGMDFISSNVSPYGAPFLFVMKKYGSIHMCINY